MKTIAAYTGPTPKTGYVGFINIARQDDVVVVTVRPHSVSASEPVSTSIPIADAVDLFSIVLSKLDAPND